MARQKRSKASKPKKSKSTRRYKRHSRNSRRPRSQKDCSYGYLYKKSYKRHRKSGRGSVRVKASCIKERGRKGPGRGGPSKKKLIPKLDKGDLTKFGYHAKLSRKSREKSLKKASKKYSPESLVHKLNALYVLNKYQDKSNAKRYKEDRDWVTKHLED